MSEANCLVHKADDADILTVEDGGMIDLNDGGSIRIGTITLTRSGSNLILGNLPTADPEVENALYSNSGVLTLSAGE